MLVESGEQETFLHLASSKRSLCYSQWRTYPIFWNYPV